MFNLGLFCIFLGEKFFFCIWENCDRWFVRFDELVRYRWIYIGEKCFVCFFCGRCFMRFDYLIKYVRRYMIVKKVLGW